MKVRNTRTRASSKYLLEIVEDRYDTRSILITSQLPVSQWYEVIGDPTLADAILDRVIHNAYRIELKGESMRKLKLTAQEKRETMKPNEHDQQDAKAAKPVTEKARQK